MSSFQPKIELGGLSEPSPQVLDGVDAEGMKGRDAPEPVPESIVTPRELEGSSGEETLNAASLPPVDAGFHAWAYLASAWILDFLVWGLPFSYGVFLKYYLSSSPVFKGTSESLLALVGSISTGILYLSCPILMPLMNRYPRQKTKVMILGYVVCIMGLVGAAYARSSGVLILTQGVMFAVGGSLLYFPMMTYLFEWFSAKRGLANGVLFSGASIGGAIAPFVIEVLLETHGQKLTLLALAVAFAVIIAPCFFFLKPRLPVAHIVANPRSMNFQFLLYRAFWILFLANILQGLGNFIPYLYLPIFASSLKLSSTASTLGVSLLNVTNAAGLVCLGWLTDHFDLRISILISSLGSAFSVFFIWGMSGSLAPYIVFSCLYGFLAPSWAALYPRFASVTNKTDDPRSSASLLSIFLAGRGIGSVISAPVSAGLNHSWAFTDKSSLAYGLEGYGPLITFTGLTLFASSLGVGYTL